MDVSGASPDFDSGPKRRVRVLRLLLEIVETNAPFQELSRPLAKKQDITLCSFFRSAVAMPDDLRLFEGDGTVRGFFRALRRALRSGRYDVIHAETPHVAFLFLLGHVMNRRLMASTVFTVSNSYSSWKPRNKLLLLPAFAFFHRVVCCGEACLSSFPALYRRLAGRRYRSVPNGVDIDRIDAAITEAPPRAEGSPFTVVSVSRLVPIKNHLAILRAFARSRHSDDRLVYVGEGSERQRLASEIAALGLEGDVELLGLLKREQVYRRMASADVYVSASHGEGLPIAVLEVMVARCPVILSDIPPHREITEGAHFIPLIPPDHVDGFAAEIARIRALSPAQRAEIGDRCRAHVEKRFALANMHAGYEEIYRELFEERRNGQGRPTLRSEAKRRASA
jgi:glycosyltransferase involved in cell wall biosynthesis